MSKRSCPHSIYMHEEPDGSRKNGLVCKIMTHVGQTARLSFASDDKFTVKT